jgi:hypothetical protein
MSDDRCPTSHGHLRCMHRPGHSGNCEVNDPTSRRIPDPPVDLDAQRELSRAARRIVELEAALMRIRTSACDAPGEGSACACCIARRRMAFAALEGLAAA